jgi:hypothetical protein
VAAPALAQRQVTVKPLTDTNAQLFNMGGGPGSSTQPCITGNLNAAAFAIVGFAAPPEDYAYVFNPLVGCSSCAIGFRVNTIHIMLRTAQACDIVMAVDVENVSDLDPACPGRSPGLEKCNSGLFSVSLPAGGLWDVALPIQCDCFLIDQLYLLSFEYVSSSCLPEPDLITDGLPTVCTSWNNFGAGWLDLVTTFGFPGNLLFYADADCCDFPIPVDPKSWGAIKALYEDVRNVEDN